MIITLTKVNVLKFIQLSNVDLLSAVHVEIEHVFFFFYKNDEYWFLLKIHKNKTKNLVPFYKFY